MLPAYQNIIALGGTSVFPFLDTLYQHFVENIGQVDRGSVWIVSEGHTEIKDILKDQIRHWYRFHLQLEMGDPSTKERLESIKDAKQCFCQEHQIGSDEELVQKLILPKN